MGGNILIGKRRGRKWKKKVGSGRKSKSVPMDKLHWPLPRMCERDLCGHWYCSHLISGFSSQSTLTPWNPLFCSLQSLLFWEGAGCLPILKKHKHRLEKKKKKEQTYHMLSDRHVRKDQSIWLLEGFSSGTKWGIGREKGLDDIIAEQSVAATLNNILWYKNDKALKVPWNLWSWYYYCLRLYLWKLRPKWIKWSSRMLLSVELNCSHPSQTNWPSLE